MSVEVARRGSWMPGMTAELPTIPLLQRTSAYGLRSTLPLRRYPPVLLPLEGTPSQQSFKRLSEACNSVELHHSLGQC
jgi:hypothetical protein